MIQSPTQASFEMPNTQAIRTSGAVPAGGAVSAILAARNQQTRQRANEQRPPQDAVHQVSGAH